MRLYAWDHNKSGSDRTVALHAERSEATAVPAHNPNRNLNPNLSDRLRLRSGGGCAAFTMVEIALSIAVVAFALVAILGVLPTGMTVQKDNRDDTVINQEGRYWMEALKNGARGLDELTNYVEAIYITNLTHPNRVINFQLTPGNGAPVFPLRSLDMIALLSTPKYSTTGDTNDVRARIKAITGPAAEKGPLTNEFSFRYEMQVEITKAFALPGTTNYSESQILYNEAVAKNLHDIRLTLRWPVVQRGNSWLVGNNRKSFRARVAGTYVVDTNFTSAVRTLYKATMKDDLHVIAPNTFNLDFQSYAQSGD